MYQSTDLVKRETLTALTGSYQLAEQEIRQAYDLLANAEKRLKAAFHDTYMEVNPTDRCGDRTGTKAADTVMKDLQRRAWACIFDRLGIKKVMSIQRRNELDNQLYNRGGHSNTERVEFPEITEENILATLRDVMGQSVDYAREAVNEIFEWLRPWHRDEYKTNQKNKWQLGNKVIISYGCERGYNSKFRVNYSRQANITALDNVFHMLDGKGAVQSHNGPLYDAICSCDGKGETEYFKFKCFQNNNLHVEFKRMDLVNKINKMAGGCQLKGE